MSTELTVVACPEKHLAFTNYVYIAATETALLKPLKPSKVAYLQVNNGTVFTVEGHKDIKAGEIGLSAFQRETLKVTQAARVQAQAWALPSSVAQANLVRLNLNVEMIGSGRKTVTEKELSEYFSSNYHNAIFNQGQIFIVDFIGTNLKLTVTDLHISAISGSSKGAQVPESDGLTARSTRGLFQKDVTELDFVSEPVNKFFSFVKEKKKTLVPANFNFQDMGIGGLDAEFSLLFRRAFASRVFPKTLVQQLGIKHVKGMLLFGPPGTGKTLIARQIGKMLATREPKIVNGPEILNKFVGQSEENIRKLFQDAEEDQAKNGDAADLHMIIFDEIDAICKVRGKSGGDTGVGDTVVNQLLSKMDGVNSLNNILVIGMTNRKDMIDPALLRPGRLEVHIEISLPDEAGRLQILKIHTKSMRENNRLGKDVDLPKLAAVTKNFSGAEIEGLVKSATSFSLYQAVDMSSGQVVIKKELEATMKVDQAAFEHALEEVIPSFGVNEEDLAPYIGDTYDYGEAFQKVMSTLKGFIEQIRNTKRQRLVPLLLTGPVGSGKTTIAAKWARDSGFPFVRMIRPSQYLGLTELTKSARISQIFEDAYKSPLSLIFIDSLENLIEYIPSGPRFSNSTLQTIVAFCSQPPPHADRKLLVIATTNKPEMFRELGFEDLFQTIKVPALTDSDEIRRVLDLMNVEFEGGEQDKDLVALSAPVPISIKDLLNRIDFATRGNVQAITPSIWADAPGNDKSK